MAKFDFNISDDFLKTLGRMQDVERIAPKMIDNAMPILLGNVKNEVAKHKRTGDMFKSIKKTKAKAIKKGGFFAVVRPTGVSTHYMSSDGTVKERKKPVRNMEILAHLEYGTSKIKPKAILSKSVKDSESAIEKSMQRTFEEEMKK